MQFSLRMPKHYEIVCELWNTRVRMFVLLESQTPSLQS